MIQTFRGAASDLAPLGRGLRRTLEQCPWLSGVVNVVILQVDLDDMEWRPHAASPAGAAKPMDDGLGAVAEPRAAAAASAGRFVRQCRCGGEFWLAEADLSEDADCLLVPCSTCSACIRVLYALAPGA